MKNIEKGNWTDTSTLDLPAQAQTHYLPINYVQQCSSSTPLRLIVDPSATGPNGISLNACELAGSSKIGDLRGCLLRFRSSQKVALGDISKFFNSFSLSTADSSLRRILIPVSGSKIGFGFDDNPIYKEFAMTNMSFGDKSAPILAALTKHKSTETFLSQVEQSLQEDVRRALIEQSYVDDLFGNVTWNEDICPLLKEIENISQQGSMSLKEWTRLGDDLQVKFLGYTWDAKEDTLQLKTWFNAGSKIRGQNLQPDLSADVLIDTLNKDFTKRKALSFLGQLFDPLLLISPIIIKLRLFYSNICNVVNPEDWDLQLDQELKDEFAKLYLQIQNIRQWKIPRSVIPLTIDVRKPACQLIIFCDGSLMGYSACAYIRFEKPNIASNLLVSSFKICGKRKLTAPKSELLAAELAVRLGINVFTETKSHLNIQSTLYLCDSKVVLSQIRLNPGKFDLFVGTRTQYIQDNSNVNDWYYVPTNQNPADLATRGETEPGQVFESFWLNGGFLLESRDSWPISRVNENEVIDNLPHIQDKMAPATLLLRNVKISNNLQSSGNFEELLSRNRSLSKVLNILSLCLKWKNKTDSKKVLQGKALAALLTDTFPDSLALVESKKPCSGEVLIKENAVYLRPRNFESQPINELVIICPHSVLGKFLIKSYHDQNHLSSVRTVQAKMQADGFYMPSSTPSIAAEKRNCPLCVKLIHLPNVQRMGDVKKQRYMQKKPFVSSYIDLAGPFRSFDNIKKRTTGKVWALVISCCYTRAIFIYCLENQSTDSVMKALERHQARYGKIDEVYSDLGTNLVAAGKVSNDSDFILQDPENIDKITKNIDWHTGVPKAPWIVGGAEASVKMLKKQLRIFKIQEGDKKLSALEWETLFARISTTINQRPLVRITEPGLTLCPNDVLHGHNQGLLDQNRISEFGLLSRYEAVQKSLKVWWKIYHEDFLKTAHNLYKWRKVENNLNIGDICLMLDSPNQVGSYRVCRVVQTYPDRRNLVRKVLVEYKTSTSKKPTQVMRSSHSLSLLLNEDVPGFPMEDSLLDKTARPGKSNVVKVQVPMDVPLMTDLHENN